MFVAGIVVWACGNKDLGFPLVLFGTSGAAYAVLAAVRLRRARRAATVTDPEADSAAEGPLHDDAEFRRTRDRS